MKKLMIAMAVVASAVFANAATVKWSSGAVLLPDSEGALTTTKLTSSSGYTMKMYAFESLSTIAYNAGDIFSWYDNGATGQFKGLDSISGTVSMGASATTAFVNGVLAPAEDGTTVYAAVLFVLEDSATGDAAWYMENSGEKATGKAVQTLANLATKIGGTGAATAWTAASAPVPEPTSGLLLVLGMAGLALRRRRA